MGEHASGTFEISGWEETPFDERDGAKLIRTSITKTFHGDIEGESAGEFLMAHGQDEGSAAYAGFERIVGRVNGRSGSFVLHHNAISDGPGGALSAAWSVLPDSGTGELRGVRGEARITREPDGTHTYTLDYELE